MLIIDKRLRTVYLHVSIHEVEAEDIKGGVKTDNSKIDWPKKNCYLVTRIPTEFEGYLRASGRKTDPAPHGHSLFHLS